MRFEPTGIERTFGADEIIVSKTDRSGKITYANEVFLRVSGYSERELLGAPHSLIRHPDMPRSVFRLLWERLEAGREIFAYVVNLSKGGDHYWVFAHVTPSFDDRGTVVGYHSNRRVAKAEPLKFMSDLYARLRAEERRFAENKQAAVDAGVRCLESALRDANKTYDELIFSMF